MKMRTLAVTAAVAACVLSAAGTTARAAEIVWSDDFTGQSNGAAPNRDFTSNGTLDWSGTTSFAVDTGVGEPAPSVTFTDGSASGANNATISMAQFAAFNTATAGTRALRVRFDMRIDSYVSTASQEGFRLILRANGSSAAGSQAVLGFGRGSLNDGDASSADNALWVASPNGTSFFTPTDATAVGLIAGSGWQPGFDFGEYDSGTGASNDTEDLFYRFDFTYDAVTGDLAGTSTRLAADATNGQSATFALAMTPGLSFSNADAGDVMIIAASNGTVGSARFDNFLVAVVPEPGGASLALAAAGLAALRRRRRAD